MTLGQWETWSALLGPAWAVVTVPPFGHYLTGQHDHGRRYDPRDNT